MQLDPEIHRVTVNGVEIALTLLEYRVLEVLLEFRGRVATRTQIVARLWGHESDIDIRAVDTHVKRLRAKLGEVGAGDRLETVRAIGYRYRI